MQIERVPIDIDERFDLSRHGSFVDKGERPSGFQRSLMLFLGALLIGYALHRSILIEREWLDRHAMVDKSEYE
ncbi:MAG: hypothetical protein H6551_03990 [Chitinophagales bacterium]|nr:hypothetical protein [Chitinophagales bacterium]